MIVLDTTVLVYAVGSEHEYREPCRSLLAAVAAGALTATTTAEVVQEFAHVRGRRRGRDDAAAHAPDVVGLLAPLLAVDERVLREGLALWRVGERLGAFDAVLAAAAIVQGADALVSADRAFAEVRGLAHVLPTAQGVLELLGQPG